MVCSGEVGVSAGEGVDVAAVVAAAGLSRRMGEPKQLLPWGEGTVIAAVVAHLAQAGASPVVCVIGHRADEMRDVLRSTGTVVVYNDNYRSSEMLGSYQAGVTRLLEAAVPCAGTLLALGDQPHVPVAVIKQVVEAARAAPERIVIPSFAMRRGHPFYIPRRLWSSLLALAGEQTLRTLLNQQRDAIDYVEVETDAILRDMDTPAEYMAVRSQAFGDESGV